MRRQRSKGAEGAWGNKSLEGGAGEGMWVGVELSLGVPGSLDGNCAGLGGWSGRRRVESGFLVVDWTII